MFLCLLRLLVNHEDHLAWRTLLGLRSNGIGESTFEAMYELARNDDYMFSQVLQRVKDEQGDENGLRYFVGDNSILTPDGRLNLYTLDNLIYYFDSAIRQRDEYKSIMQSRKDALAAVGNNPQAVCEL